MGRGAGDLLPAFAEQRLTADIRRAHACRANLPRGVHRGDSERSADNSRSRDFDYRVLGSAYGGPTDKPVSVNGMADYERTFGSVSPAYPMSYAVRDFFVNGGSQALIVRLYHEDDPSGTPPPRTTVDVGGLKLDAAAPGL